jgi:hypothetical protein
MQLLFAAALVASTAAPLARPRLAVMGFQAPELGPETLAALEDAVAQAAGNLAKMDIVGASDLRAVLSLGQLQQLTGCQDKTCMTEFGSLLAVQQMLSGSVRKVGQSYALSVQLMDLVNGRVLNRATQEIPQSTEALFGAARQQVAVLFGVVGQVRVWNQPAGAELFLDGALVGQTPIDVVTVRAPGKHVVSILGPGVTPWKEEVDVYAGVDLRLQARNRSLEELRVEADDRRGTTWLLAGGAAVGALGCGVMWLLAVRSDRRLDAIDRRTASQEELDAITDQTLTFALTSGAFAIIAAALGGSAAYVGMNNEAADLLAETGQ